MICVRIWFIPEERIGNITIHDHWAADNFRQTTTANTKDEIIDRVKKMWPRVPVIEVESDHMLMTPKPGGYRWKP